MDDRTAIAIRWRERADELDRYACRCVGDGDSREAADAEQAATEYRIAADDEEAGLLSTEEG